MPESDPVYQEERERWRAAHQSAVFGASSLGIYETDTFTREGLLERVMELQRELDAMTDKDGERARHLSEDIQSASDYATTLLQERAKFLRTACKTLMNGVLILLGEDGREDRKEFVFSEIGRMLSAPEIQDELRRNFGDDLSALPFIKLYRAIEEDKLSDECLYAMVKRHVEDIRAQERKLQEIVAETKDKFRTAVTEAVSRGVLPETAAASLRRIDEAEVFLSDRLLSVRSSRIGDSHDSGAIDVSNEQLQDRLLPRMKKSLYHEFLHELSGKSITVLTEANEGPHTSRYAFSRKNGVSLGNPQSQSEYSPNTWLNEAITEWLTLKLSGYAGDTDAFAYQGSMSYPIERKELDRLFAAGLEEEVVVNAYFENLTSDQLKGEKGKHFAKLVHRINELEGPAGFTRLEHAHIMNDIEASLLSNGVSRVVPGAVHDDALPPEAKVYTITVRVGTSDQAPVTQQFEYIAAPKTVGTTIVSTEYLWGSVKDTLTAIENLYGRKVTISVAERRQ